MKLECCRNVFSSRRRVMRDVSTRTDDGRLFHARGTATGNARSAKVDCRAVETEL